MGCEPQVEYSQCHIEEGGGGGVGVVEGGGGGTH